MRTPSDSAASARPQANLAGSIIATSGSNRAPRAIGEVILALTAAASRYSIGCDSRLPSSPSSRRSSTCQSKLAMSSSPVRSMSASIPYFFAVAQIASSVSVPIRSNSGSSSAYRSSPLPSPCVRLAAQKPPLRPVAPSAMRSPSSNTIDLSGFSSAACRAAHNPVNPPPTITRSADVEPECRGLGVGRSGRSSQKGCGAAPRTIATPRSVGSVAQDALIVVAPDPRVLRWRKRCDARTFGPHR